MPRAHSLLSVLFVGIVVFSQSTRAALVEAEMSSEQAQQQQPAMLKKGSNLRGPLLTLTHGGGPLPLLGSQQELVELWSKHVDSVLAPARPDAIILVSAHYHHDGGAAKVLGVERPRMIFDYGGFPKESYEFKYPAPGHPALARKIHAAMLRIPALQSATLDTAWGFDHGAFVPLMIMARHASIPVVPVSVSSTDDAAVQLAVGEAIRAALTTSLSESPRQDEDFALPNVAVIGSGSIFHNFEYIMGSKRGKAVDPAFDDAFAKLLTDPAISPAQRKEALLNWKKLPGAAVYQPIHSPGGCDHMMPLLTLAAVAGYTAAPETVSYTTFGAKSTDFIWR